MPSRCRPLLGTLVEIAADDADAIEAGFDAVERVHRLMSAHRADSDVSRINRCAHIRPVQVHEWTGRVIERALFWSRASGGAFDVVRAGKAALERARIPRHADQPAAEAAHWTWLEAQGVSVRLLRPGCVDLGGIAKGFAVDRAIDALSKAGCERGLVNAGGDLRGFGREPWRVAVVDPLSRHSMVTIDIDNEALATSAGLPADGGLTFDHLPGGNRRWVSVSVLARTACDADALTKIVWRGIPNAGGLLAASAAKALAINATGDVEAIREFAEAAA